MDKDIQVIDNSNKIGRPSFDFNSKILDQIKDLASYMCSKPEIAKIIGCSESTLQRNQLAQEAYELGVAQAKKTIRKTQFDIATKLNSSMMAIYLGRVYLGQNTDNKQSEDDLPLPIDDIMPKDNIIDVTPEPEKV